MTTQSPDRRARRTRARLHEALACLIHEKPYERVAVKEILARADVGRSTFYNHFESKDELLDSSIRDVLESGRTAAPSQASSIAEEVLQSARRVFDHLDRHVAAGKRLDVRGQALVHKRLETLLVRRTADVLERSPSHMRNGLPDELIAQFVASTFAVVLQWRLERNIALASGKATEMLGRLLAPVLSQKL